MQPGYPGAFVRAASSGRTDPAGGYTEIEEKYTKESGSKYFDKVKKLEKELSKYVRIITKRIDNINEHIHHLKLN